MKKTQSIGEIKKDILNYYEMSFQNQEEDYLYNKRLKNRLKDIVIKAKNNNTLKEEALVTLAESTGCVEDQIIAEEILDYLFENKLINRFQLDLFYKNIGTSRWL